MYLGYSKANNQYAQWLLEIGTGSTMDDNKMIQVPQSMVCANLNGLINRIYPGISNTRAQDDQYFLDCIILCPRNDQVHDINGISPWKKPVTPPRDQTVLQACSIVCDRLAAIWVFRTSRG